MQKLFTKAYKLVKHQQSDKFLTDQINTMFDGAKLQFWSWVKAPLSTRVGVVYGLCSSPENYYFFSLNGVFYAFREAYSFVHVKLLTVNKISTGLINREIT